MDDPMGLLMEVAFLVIAVIGMLALTSGGGNAAVSVFIFLLALPIAGRIAVRGWHFLRRKLRD
jgi:hypothetical protein